jgi:hypothetical protein
VNVTIYPKYNNIMIIKIKITRCIILSNQQILIDKMKQLEETSSKNSSTSDYFYFYLDADIN